MLFIIILILIINHSNYWTDISKVSKTTSCIVKTLLCIKRQVKRLSVLVDRDDVLHAL